MSNSPVKRCPVVTTKVFLLSIHSRLLAVLTATLAFVFQPQLTSAQDPEAVQFFRTNCASCHTIGGGRLTGPDLKNVEQRKDRDWLIRFIMDPQGVIQSGDPYAQKLLEESRGVVMPKIMGMTRERAEALLDLIAVESQKEKSQFAGLSIPTEPFTPEQIQRGRDYFMGRRRLAQGGPPCFTCHTVRGLGLLGGGRLGPDLTRVFERLQGRRGLAAWLQAPATPTMQQLFQKHPLQSNNELLELVAFLEDVAKRGGGEADLAGPLACFLIGLAGAVVALLLADAAWRNRLRSVRRSLVAAATAKQLDQPSSP